MGKLHADGHQRYGPRWFVCCEHESVRPTASRHYIGRFRTLSQEQIAAVAPCTALFTELRLSGALSEYPAHEWKLASLPPYEASDDAIFGYSSYA